MIQQQQPKPSNVDWLLLTLYAIFVVAGLLCIYASVYREDHPMIYDTTMNYGKQIIWIGLSLFIGILILFVDEKFFYAFAYPIYGITIFLLIAVLLMGTTVKGSSSWIEIGGFRMQPAEFAKFGSALALAKFLSGYNIKFKEKKTQIVAYIFSFLPAVIILFQNETGSALVFGAFVFVLYREGLPGWILFLRFAVIVLSILALLIAPLYLMIAIGVIAALFTLLIRRNRQNLLIVAGVTIAMMAYVSSVELS